MAGTDSIEAAIETPRASSLLIIQLLQREPKPFSMQLHISEGFVYEDQLTHRY